MVNREGQEAESPLKGVHKLELKADREWWTFGEVRKGTGGKMEKWLLWTESEKIQAQSENNGTVVVRDASKLYQK